MSIIINRNSILNICLALIGLALAVRFIMARFIYSDSFDIDSPPQLELYLQDTSDLGDYRDDVVLLVFMSVSCNRCEHDISSLAAIIRDSSFAVNLVLVSRTDRIGSLKTFSSIYAGSAPVSAAKPEFMEYFQPREVPQYYLFDYRANTVLTTRRTIGSLEATLEVLSSYLRPGITRIGSVP